MSRWSGHTHFKCLPATTISYNMPDKQNKSSNHHMDISSVLGTNGPTIPTNITNASETWMVCMYPVTGRYYIVHQSIYKYGPKQRTVSSYYLSVSQLISTMAGHKCMYF